MKNNNSSKAKIEIRRPGVVEIGLIALPILALIPNIFVPPALSMVGLATQELAIAIYATIIGVAVIWESWRQRADGFHVRKDDLTLIIALLVFIGWQLLSLIQAPTMSDGIRLIGIWAAFAFFLLLILLRMSPVVGRVLFHLLTLICLVLAITILYERYLYGPVMLGFFFNHGITAEILVTLIPVQVASFFKARQKLMVALYFVVSSLGVIAIFTGLRRGALVSLAISLVLLGLLWLFKAVDLGDARRGLIVVIVLMIGAAAFGARNWEEISYRLDGAIRVASPEGGLMIRLRSWMTGIEMIKKHPLAGVGQSGYPILYGDYRKEWVNKPENAALRDLMGPEDEDEIRSPLAHNEYLQTMVELGSVGLILFLNILVLLGYRLWKQIKRARSHLAAGGLIGMIAFCISSLTSGFSFRYTPETIVLASLLGVAIVLGQAEGQDEQGENTRIRVPDWLPKMGAVLLLIIFGMLTWRAERVFRSQQLQGQETMGTEVLDFAYYPDSENGNESLARRYRQVLAYDPSNSGAHLGYGLLLFQLKQNKEALIHAEYAWRNGFSRPFAYVLVAFIREQLGDLPRATEILEEAAAAYPQSFFVRASLAELLRRGGRIEEMRRHQEEMYARDRRSMEDWEVYLRSNLEKARAEASQRGLMQIRDFNNRLAITLVAIRGYHYTAK